MTKFQELFPLIFLINLDKRTDRLEKSLQELSKIKLTEVIRMPGQIYDKTPYPFINGSIGCMLSHRLCLEEALRQKKNVFIFEDDIQFIGHHNLYEIIEETCEELEKIKFDVFYLGANLLRPAHQISNRLAKLTSAKSTVAYATSYNFIEKLLSYFPTDEFNEPIDATYDNNVVPNNNCYISIPMCVVQRNDYSDIEGQNVKYTEYLENRYWSNLVRKVFNE
jgi:GR25 family glycosyltransferase involved in LPS biosynthesis